MQSDMPTASSAADMVGELVATLEDTFRDVGVTSERVSEEDLMDAIVASVREPAVAMPLDEFPVSFENTPITADPTPAELWEAKSGVTVAAWAIAEYGSLYLPQAEHGSELLSLFVEHHVAIVRESSIIRDVSAGFERLETEIPDTRSSGIIATGPSATADMGELVKGAHGPASVHVLIVRGE